MNRQASSPDAIVIGGGIIGLSIALRLAEAKLRVLVLDRQEPGQEASRAAAGMLAPQGEMVTPEPFFQMAMASHRLYPDFVSELEQLTNDAVGWRREGSLQVAMDEEQSRAATEFLRVQRSRGLPVELLAPEDVHRLVPGLSPDLRGGLFLPQDHWVDSEKLTEALIEACRRRGVTFARQSCVRQFQVRGNRVEAAVVANEAGAAASLSAGSFVLAAGCWSGEINRSVATIPCRGQMIEFEAPHELPCVVRSGHHYLVPRSSGRVVLGSTMEYVGYQKAVTGDGLRSLLEGAGRFAPVVGQYRFRRAWAGLRPDTPDHLPVLGYGELSNLIFATGHFRNGILLAPVTAQLISELLLRGRTSMPLEPYRPTRFAVQSAASPS